MVDLGQDRPTKAKVACAIRAVAKWRNMTEVYSSRAAVSKADDMLGELDRIMEAIGAKGLSKSNRGSGKSKFLES